MCHARLLIHFVGIMCLEGFLLMLGRQSQKISLWLWLKLAEHVVGTHEALSSSSVPVQQGMVVHARDLSSLQVGAGVSNHFVLHGESKASLDYMRPCPKNKDETD